MNELSERISRLAPARKALFEKLLREKGGRPSSERAIPKRGTLETAPLSYAQQRLWFLDQLEPGSSAYNIFFAIRLSGHLDVTALERGLREILRRHEALRTTFVTENDEPLQKIASVTPFTLQQVDLSTMPDEQREAEVRRLTREEASRPFDLAAGPLLRVRLLRLTPQEHILLLTLHHIVFDGWSMGILYRELSALYKAFSNGNPSPLDDLPIQYADFAVWQRQWLQGVRLDEQLSYWKKQLGGNLPVLDLPIDYPRRPMQTHRGDRCSLRLSRELSCAMNALCQRTGNTLFMMMLASFNILLHRLTAQDDIIIGTPIAGRNRLETEGLIGVFINTLVMRTDLSGSPTFLDVLSRVGKVAVDAYSHQDLPFEKLVEALQPERDLSRTPLFQVMLNMQNPSDDFPELSDLKAEIISPSEEDSKFDFTLYVSPDEKGILLDLVYNADLFGGQRVAEMLGQMGHLLKQVVEDPAKSIGLYSLRSTRSLSFLPDPYSALHEPEYLPVTSMFLSHADRSPHHPAVTRNGQSWSYRQLSEGVTHLAGVLRNGGINKGDVVAVTGPRSFGLITGIVAVFSSGGVLLTVDENLPAMRKRIMCQEAKAKCLLHIGEGEKERQWFNGLFPSGIITVEEERGLAAGVEEPFEPSGTDLPELSPNDAAYIFFTSGSTGVPKGVLGCHKGLSHFLTWQKDTFAVGPLDRCAQLTNPTFDVVLRDIFLPLISGGTLCLPDESDGPFSDGVLSWLERERVTLLHTVPSVAKSWLGNIPPGTRLRSLRYVFFAGEPLRETLVRRWRAAFPVSGQIVNLYGTTETTLAKCFYVVPDDIAPGAQPVGRPLPETQALILSEKGLLCGIGELGEIVLRTPFRTRGYVNNPQEEQLRFMRNHFRDDPEDILYHTGDLGRYRHDGLLTVLGRRDHQVKINGVRIEPDEVAAVLERHPHIRSAVVTARQSDEEECSLVGYIVCQSQLNVSTSELRAHLGKHLPEYMIPSAFVMLDSLPLTPNGKVDRKALPAPYVEKPDIKEAFIAPSTPLEEALASMWCQVLGLERVGIRDNFFELGGHSLIATQLASRIRRDLNFRISVRGIFEHPTIELLAFCLIEKEISNSAFESMDEQQSQMEFISDGTMERLLAQNGLPKGGVEDRDGEGTHSSSLPFSCPRKKSELFGRHECNLLMVINEEFDLSAFSSFERVAKYVKELDPSINVAVVRDRAPMDLNLPDRPTLIFSPALIRNYPPVKEGRIFCGQPLSKSEEYAALEKAGIPVPPWALLTEGETPDLSRFDDYVVRKPDHGGRGAKVVAMRKNRLRWRPIVTKSAGLSPSTIIQEFIYTGPWPVSYRVNTLFGRVLYSNKFVSSGDGPGLAGPKDFKSAVRHEGVSIVASAKGSRLELNYDEEIIMLAESAHGAFPEVPLLGFDIVREVPSGKLYVLEANAIGYVWKINTKEYGIPLEEQFDGVRKAAYILAERTQQIASQSSSGNISLSTGEHQTAEAGKTPQERNLSLPGEEWGHHGRS